MTSTNRISLRAALLAAAAALLVAAPAQAASWTPAADITTLAPGYAMVASDVSPAGDALVAVGDAVPGGKHAIRTSLRPAGGAFTEQLLPDGGSAQVPEYAAVAADFGADGRAIVAWEQNNGLFYALRAPGGQFGAPEQVSGLPTVDTNSLDVALDGAGNATFIWTTRTGSFGSFKFTAYSIERRADGALVFPQTLATKSSGTALLADPTVEVNAAGAAVLTLREVDLGPDGISYAFRTAALSAFGGIGTDSTAFNVAPAIGTGGDAVLVIDGMAGVQARYKKAGGGLGAAKVLDAKGLQPAAGVAADGTATALWEKQIGTTHSVHACSFTTAGCLAPAETLTTGTTPIGVGRLAVAPSGAMAAVWSEDPFGNTVVVGSAKPAGGAWSPLTTLGAPKSTLPHVGIDDTGQAFSAWLTEGQGATVVRGSTFLLVDPPVDTGQPAPPVQPVDPAQPATGGQAPAGTPAGAPQRDTRAPRFTKAPRANKTKRGLSFGYALDEAAKVTVAIERRLVTKKGRVAFKKVKTLTVSSRAGASRVAFSAAKGRYRATFIARDAAGNSGKRVKLSFAVTA